MSDARVLEEFSGVVASIYEAALAPERWPAAVARIAHLQRSDKALLLTPMLAPDDGGFVFPHGIDEATLLDWGARYIQHDIWTQAGLRKGYAAGVAVTDTDLVADDEFLASVFYREFLSRVGIGRLCSGLALDHQAIRAPVTSCSVYRPRSARPFEGWNRRLHGMTLNHLSKSLGTMLRLRDAELRVASTLGALNRIRGNVLLLDRDGRVLFANDAALALLRGRDGLCLLACPTGRAGVLGRLHAAHPGDHERLQSDILAAIQADPLQVGNFSHGVRIARPSGHAPLVVQVAPLPGDGELLQDERRARAIAFVIDPAESLRLDGVMLETLYGLTPAETRLAEQLLLGDAPADIARRLDVSENTIKTQLHSLFAKTGTHRQAALVRLLASLALP